MKGAWDNTATMNEKTEHIRGVSAMGKKKLGYEIRT